METQNNNKYVKDQAEPESDMSALDEIFNVAIDNNLIVDANTGEIISEAEITDEVKAMRKELKDLEDDLPDVDQFIVDNINRANRILDKVEEDITGDRGNYTASLIEACSNLINTVTSAANSITGITVGQEQLRQKERALDIKEKEVAIKGIMKGDGNVTVNNNSLIMNREELMKMIKEGPKPPNNQ
jgi:hypothetical protein